MKRAEFLEILKESLERKIPQDEINDNLRYYREYFEQSDCSDEELCEELGDPRLIAKSVTNAYLASKGPMADAYTQQARSEFSQMHGSASYEEHTQSGSVERAQHKIVLWCIEVIAVVFLAYFVRLTSAILIPILFLVILWKLIRRG